MLQELLVRHVQIRFSEEEHAALEKAAAGVPLQRYLRSLILQTVGHYTRSAIDALNAGDRELIERATELLGGDSNPAAAAVRAVLVLAVKDRRR